MNIIVTNKCKDLINGTNIEVMKELNGVFKVSEIANSFNSIFYKKLIIDATALDRFPKEDVLRDLVKTFDTEKLILFLPPDNPPPMKFLSFLVSINLYNFTDNIKGLLELVKKSNTYEDVKEFVKDNTNTINQDQNQEMNFNQDTLNIQDDKIILGIRSVNEEFASTELSYTLMKALEDYHRKQVLAVEVDKKDFMYYNSKNMYSISSNKLGEFFSTVTKNEIVLVDLNKDDKNNKICTDIIYLIDPSLYRINQLMMKNKNAFNELKGKKVVLYNSLLNDNDVNIFAKEAGISVYFNLPPLSDRTLNPILNSFLSKLGLISVSDERQKKGLFDIFK